MSARTLGYVLIAVGTLLVHAPMGGAQTWDPGPGWELYGDSERFMQEAISFSDVGSLWASQIRMDSLVVDGSNPRGRWHQVNFLARFYGPAFFATSRVLLTSPPLWRSTDRGRTWEQINEYQRFHAMPQEAGHGTRILLGGRNNRVAFSDDYGTTFTEAVAPGPNWLLGVEHWASMPENGGPPRQGGRLFAGSVFGGVALSDDGGATWRPSGLWNPSVFIDELETLAIPPEEGGGIRVVALGVSGEPCTCRRVWTSEDGGETFAEVSRIPIDPPRGAAGRMTLIPVMAGRPSGPSNPVPSWQTSEALIVFLRGAIFRTVDGGRTWSRVPGPEGQVPFTDLGSLFVRSATLGPDGRLYPAKAQQDLFQSWPVRSAGSYVTSTAAPPASPSLVVGPVAPNPASGDARLPLHLPGVARVRVEVLDLLGRVVAGEPETSHPAGPSSARLRVGGLSPGVYVARVVAEWSGGVEVRSRRFTVAR